MIEQEFKSFAQYNTEHPELYDGITYLIKTGDNEYSNATVPQSLKATIFDQFQFRYLCDKDEKFTVFFRRVLTRDLTQWAELVEIENPQFVKDFLTDHDNISEDTNTNSGTRESTTSGTETGKTTSSTTTGQNTTSTDGGEDTTTGEDTTNTTTSEHTGATDSTHSVITPLSGDIVKNKHIEKLNPMSASYANAAAGEIPALDQQYATSQTQTEEAHTKNGLTDTTETTVTHESTTNGTANTKGSTKSTNKYGKTNTTETTGTGSGTNETKKDNTLTQNDTENGTSKNAHKDSGRNKEIGEVLLKNMYFIQRSSAWAQLAKRLEPCFLGIYEA